MTIRIVKRGASKDKPPFCPYLIDYPCDQPETEVGTRTNSVDVSSRRRNRRVRDTSSVGGAAHHERSRRTLRDRARCPSPRLSPRTAACRAAGDRVPRRGRRHRACLLVGRRLGRAVRATHGRITVAIPSADDAVAPLLFILTQTRLIRLDQSGLEQPALIERWTQSADKRTWTLFVRDGVRLHDGRVAMAADVVSRWKNALEPAPTQAGALARHLGRGGRAARSAAPFARAVQSSARGALRRSGGASGPVPATRMTRPPNPSSRPSRSRGSPRAGQGHQGASLRHRPGRRRGVASRRRRRAV